MQIIRRQILIHNNLFSCLQVMSSEQNMEIKDDLKLVALLPGRNRINEYVTIDVRPDSEKFSTPCFRIAEFDRTLQSSQMVGYTTNSMHWPDHYQSIWCREGGHFIVVERCADCSSGLRARVQLDPASHYWTALFAAMAQPNPPSLPPAQLQNFWSQITSFFSRSPTPTLTPVPSTPAPPPLPTLRPGFSLPRYSLFSSFTLTVNNSFARVDINENYCLLLFARYQFNVSVLLVDHGLANTLQHNERELFRFCDVHSQPQRPPSPSGPSYRVTSIWFNQMLVCRLPGHHLRVLLLNADPQHCISPSRFWVTGGNIELTVCSCACARSLRCRAQFLCFV